MRVTESPVKARTADEVVVGVDDSQASVAALAWAMSTAAEHGWSVVALTAWPEPEAPFIHAVPGHYCEPRAHAVARLDRAVADASLRSGLASEDATAVQRLVENAHPVDALVTRSRAARMLVLGTRGAPEAPDAPHVPVGLLCSSLAACPVVQVDAVADPPNGPPSRAGGLGPTTRLTTGSLLTEAP